MTTTAASIASSSCCYCSSSSLFCSSSSSSSYYKFNNNNHRRSIIRISNSSSSIYHNPIFTLSSSSSSLSTGVGFGPTQFHQKQQQGSSRLLVSCQVALNSIDELSKEEEDDEMKKAQDKIGSRVRVKVASLKVYHVPKIPELDLTGMEGELKQYVGLWKGKRISANFPFKIQFFTQIQDRAPVKFFAHLKEDEFDYIDPPLQS
ncbi:hypothetical protein AQUCO_03500005v1 [Aquilegia coerulea]|uniref:Ferredoxin thioredoxin reductase alpha chain domain-containing protein n=1 Tax=Aquilegia coerulea TaxID=218851 RepID=A0A2G5CVK6_AQUCA|nr:hypothetical protein AQUCO_03500005v1 [Aquilegia coerulea]